MPSITRNPDDELIRRLTSLESRLQSLETQRSRPAVVAGVGFRGGQALPANTYTTLDMNTVKFDSSGMVDLANDRIKVPYAGVYTVTVAAMASGSQTSGNVEILVNGSIVADQGGPNGGFSTVCVTYAQALSAGAAVSAQFVVGGGAATLLAGAYMVLTRISD